MFTKYVLTKISVSGKTNQERLKCNLVGSLRDELRTSYLFDVRLTVGKTFIVLEELFCWLGYLNLCGSSFSVILTKL